MFVLAHLYHFLLKHVSVCLVVTYKRSYIVLNVTACHTETSIKEII